MTKWTKGPWTHDMADHTSPVDDIIIKSSERMGNIGRLWQDDNCGPDQRDFNAEQAANANLIAAAPDLYEALAAFERCIDLWLPADENVKEEHYGEAEALAGLHREMLRVMGKARGEL